MSSTPSTLEILIDIRSRLDALNATQAGMRGVVDETKKANDAAAKFTSLFQQGLGIGSGIEIAQRAIGIFKAVVDEAFRGAMRLAGEVRDGSEALGVTGEAYQVLQLELAKANVDMGRFTMAVSTQTQGLAEVRAGASAAAEAYRALGLSAAQIEALSPEERVIAVARATLSATDQTKAFQAAGQILGTRGLPQLLSALRGLASEGYDNVAKAAKAAGLVMSDDVASRLDAAQKNIEKFKRWMVVTAGETLGAADMVKTSFEKDFMATAAAFLRAYNLPSKENLIALAKTIGKNQPPPVKEEKAPGLPTEEVARRERLQSELRQAQLQLGTIQAASAVAEQNTTEADADRSQRKLALLKYEVVWREKIVELLTEVQKFASGTEEEKASALVSATAELAAAQNAFAAAGGKGANFPAERLEASLALLEQQKEFARVANESDPLGDEITLRTRLLPLLREQDELYRKLAKAQFPDADELLKKHSEGTITPDELARLNQFTVLRSRVVALMREENGLKITGNVPEVLPKGHAQSTSEEFGRFSKGRNEAGEDRLTVAQGPLAGAQQFVMSLGTQGEQVAGALENSLGATVASIGDGIWGWITGVSTFSDAMRNLAGTVLKTVLDTIVQTGVQWLVMAAIGKMVRSQESNDTRKAVGEKAAEGGMKSIAQLGPIWGPLAFAAAVGTIFALSRGFSAGGYTGSGSVTEVAGVVHKGEVVWSQKNINDAGGLAAVESMRLGGASAALESLPIGKPTLLPTAAHSLSVSSSMAANASVAAQQKKEYIIAFAQDYTDIRRLKRQAGWDKAIIQTVRNNLGEIWSA